MFLRATPAGAPQQSLAAAPRAAATRRATRRALSNRALTPRGVVQRPSQPAVAVLRVSCAAPLSHHGEDGDIGDALEPASAGGKPRWQQQSLMSAGSAPFPALPPRKAPQNNASKDALFSTGPLRVRMRTGCTLVVQLGDITRYTGDALVNAANSTLMGGGGVDGAIHRAAGPELLAECRKLPTVAPGTSARCPTGEARITRGGRLQVRHVIHAVGPVYHDHSVSPGPLLAATHAYALELARSYGAESVAFPAISCGVFGYPHAAAADVATRVIARHSAGLREVAIIIADRAHLDTWRKAAARIAVKKTQAQNSNSG